MGRLGLPLFSVEGVGWMDDKGEVIVDDGKTKDRASFLSQNEPLL